MLPEELYAHLNNRPAALFNKLPQEDQQPYIQAAGETDRLIYQWNVIVGGMCFLAGLLAGVAGTGNFLGMW